MITNIFVVTAEVVVPVTFTIETACQRHNGLKKETLQIMCVKKQIRAQKVGKLWHIPASELDRVFLGKK